MLKLFAYPSYLVTGLFLDVLSPIEFFKIEVQELLWLEKILCF